MGVVVRERGSEVSEEVVQDQVDLISIRYANKGEERREGDSQIYSVGEASVPSPASKLARGPSTLPSQHILDQSTVP